MIASCENRQSPYTDLCNTRDSKNGIRVIADGFVYKSKYCALCHGFVSYSQITLELAHCNTSVNIAGIEMTIPDETCTLDVTGDSILGSIEENVNISSFPYMNKLNYTLADISFRFTSYFDFSNQQCAGRYRLLQKNLMLLNALLHTRNRILGS